MAIDVPNVVKKPEKQAANLPEKAPFHLFLLAALVIVAAYIVGVRTVPGVIPWQPVMPNGQIAGAPTSDTSGLAASQGVNND